MSWQDIIKPTIRRPVIRRPVIRKAAEKKSETHTIAHVTFTHNFPKLRTVEKDYNTWKTTTKGLQTGGIGIIGSAAQAYKNSDKEYKDSLYELVQHHVRTEVKRPPKKDHGKGAEFLIDLLDTIIIDDNTPILESEVEEVLEYIKDLVKMGAKDSKTNPANIPFTEPVSIIESTKDGKRTYVKSEETVTVRGHYRTPMYVDVRTKVSGKKGEPPAVKDYYYHYGDMGGSNTPPFWQALFADSSLKVGAGKDVEKGILGILEDLKKATEDGGGPQHVLIRDRGQMKNRVEELAKIKPLIDELKKVMKNPTTFKGNTKAVNGMKLLDNANKLIIKNTGAANEYLLKLMGGQITDDLPMALKNIATFSIEFTRATLDNLINLAIRGEVMLAPTGLPYSLPSDGSHAKIKNLPWYGTYQAHWAKDKAAKKKVKDDKKAAKNVKKSWSDMLWG